VAVTDRQALEGLIAMSRLEGIIPALETSHAIYHACFKLASSFGEGDGVIDIVLGVSGRGDKDVEQVQKLLSENFKDLLQMKRSQKE
jgi:tryptophan synthase beta chain